MKQPWVSFSIKSDFFLDDNLVDQVFVVSFDFYAGRFYFSKYEAHVPMKNLATRSFSIIRSKTVSYIGLAIIIFVLKSCQQSYTNFGCISSWVVACWYDRQRFAGLRSWRFRNT